MTDRTAIARCLTAVLFWLLAALSGPSCANEHPGFRKGINLARLHSLPAGDPQRPGEFLWPPFRPPLAEIGDGELRRLRATGFDFVRLPVAPAPFLAVSEGERRILLDGVFDTVKRLQAFGFGVLVDPHPIHSGRWSAPGMLADIDGEEFREYGDWLEVLARNLKRLPASRTALGLMNEPQRDCHLVFGRDWTEIQPLLFARVRKAAPELALVLTTGCYSSFEGLPHLRMAGYDENTLIDIHYYRPYYFTHQSLPFASIPTRYMAGLWYPGQEGDPQRSLALSEELIAQLRREKGEDAVPRDALEQAMGGVLHYYEDPPVDRAYIRAHFEAMRRWAEEEGVAPNRLVIGEFGAARPAAGMPENASRYSWISDVRDEAEASGFAWAYWDYNAGDGYPGFGLVFDNESRKIDPDAVTALGLDAKALKAGTQ